MNFLILTMALIFGLNAQAGNHKHDHKKKNHKAHVHGHAKMLIASTAGKSFHIEVEIPADSVYGFEHVAKSDKDKKTVKEKNAILVDKSSEIVVFPAGCKTNKVEVKESRESPDSDHSELVYHLMIDCEKSVSGEKAKIALGKFFSKIEDLDVSLVGDKKQSEVELENAQGEIKLP